MLELARYYGRKRLRGSVAFAVGIGLLVALYIWMFPTITESIDLNEYVEAWPPALRAAFGVEALGTIEGFLAAELYAFVWVLLLGLYLAYAAASVIADDVERDRMDLLLSLPVARWHLLVEKYLSLLVPILVVNLTIPVVIYAGVLSIDESISILDLAVVHASSIPYLLTTAGIGLVCSVAFSRAGIAQRVAMSVVFGLFLVDSVVTDTEYEWIGAVSPTRHYDPTGILVHTDYNLLGVAGLSAAALLLVIGSSIWFTRMDVT